MSNATALHRRGPLLLARLSFAAALVVALGASGADKRPGQRTAALSSEAVAALGRASAALIEGRTMASPSTVHSELTAPAETSVYVDVRGAGRRLFAQWGDGPHAMAAVVAALQGFDRRALDDVADAVIINVAHDFRAVDASGESGLLADLNHGVLGLEIRHESTLRRIAPTESIARNQRLSRTFQIFMTERWPAGVLPDNLAVRVFDADQIHVALGKQVLSTRLYRGTTLVDVRSIDRARVRAWQLHLAGWLFTNLHDDGRMTYKLWPSKGGESSANNLIRQWMATHALTRIALADGDRASMSRVERNVRYNLEHFYELDANGAGLIIDDGDIKLGAVALAALAIVEHPARAQFVAQETALRTTVDRLWQDSGAFRTFLRPAERNDNQNFYPGEALLLWATLYDESVKRGAPDLALLARCMRSFDYYRTWHLAHRNPAFVPWHTQAYYRLWQHTREPRLRDFILEMNDWLVDNLQQWDDVAAYPDAMGQFHKPGARFGPPHASSTGVYLEGLIDAWSLARATRDRARQEKYRRAIVRGLRSVMQLTYDTDLDMYYTAQRQRLRGGVRSAPYDTEVRVDNVQHNLLAALKILDRFERQDYRP